MAKDKIVLTNYRYRGPQSGVTLRLPSGDEMEVQLINGKDASLPADHPYVSKLKLQGHLADVDPIVPVQQPALKSAQPKTTAQTAQVVKEDVTNAG